MKAVESATEVDERVLRFLGEADAYMFEGRLGVCAVERPFYINVGRSPFR